MPDIFNPLDVNIEPTSIDKVDLNQYVNKPQANSNPLASFNFKPIDDKTATLATVDNSRLSNVENYDSYKSNPTFNPNFTDLQNQRDYAYNQGNLEYAKNLGVKLFSTTAGAFTNNFKQHARNVDALLSWDLSKASDTTDDSFQKEQDRLYPTMGSGENSGNSFLGIPLRYVPFTKGSGDFYGSMVPSLGFTIGTIGATVLENAALGVLTGGVGNALEAVESATSIGRSIKALYKGFTGTESYLKGLENLNNIGKEVSTLSRIQSGAKSLANAYQMYSTAASEASFEGATTYNDVLQQQKDDYLAKYGYNPFGDDLTKMEQKANSAKNATFLMNVPVLMVSNFEQFDNILRPYKVAENTAIKLGINSATHQIEKEAFKPFFQFGSKSVQSIWDTTQKVGATLGKYSKGAFSEGREEISQGFIQSYNKAYYTSLEDNSAFSNGIKAAKAYGFSDQFWDDFVGGALGGLLFEAPQSIYSHYKNKGNDTRLINSLNSVTPQDLIKEGLVNNKAQAEAINIKNQAFNTNQMANAVQNGNVLFYKDAQDKAFNEFAYTAAQTGKLDLRREQLALTKESLNDISVDEFKNKFDLEKTDENKDAIEKVIDEHLSRLNDYEKDYEKVQSYYKNPYKVPSISQNSTEEELNNYNSQRIKYEAFELAKRDRIGVRQAVMRDQYRQSEIFKNIQKDTDNAYNVDTLKKLYDKTEREKHLSDLKTYLENYKLATVDDENNKKQIEALTKQIELVDSLNSTLNKGNTDYTTAYELGDLMSNILSSEALAQNKKTDKELDLISINKNINQNLSDALILEARNVKNVADYKILQGKAGIEDLFNKHVQSLQATLQTRENNTNIKLDTEETTNIDNLSKEEVQKKLDDASQQEGQEKIVSKLEEKLKTFESTSTEDASNEKPLPEKFSRGNKKSTLISYKSSSVTFDEDISLEAEKSTGDKEFHRRNNLFLEHLKNNTLKDKNGKVYTQDEIKVIHLTRNSKNLLIKEIGNIFGVKENFNSDTEPILQLFVNKDGIPFLLTMNDKGNPIIQLIEQPTLRELKSLVYTFMSPSTETHYLEKEGIKNSGNSYIVIDNKTGEKIKDENFELRKQTLELHREKRTQLSKDENPKSFYISKGLSNINRTEFSALTSVSSTAAALEKGSFVSKFTNYKTSFEIAEAYHKAKQTNTNLELIKQVEDLLKSPKNSVASVKLLSNDNINSASIHIYRGAQEYDRVISDGEDRFLERGMPYLKIASPNGKSVSYTRLLNDKFSSEQKNTIKEVLKSLLTETENNVTQFATKLDNKRKEFKFLQSLLYLEKGKKRENIEITHANDKFTIKYDFSTGTPNEITISSLEDLNKIEQLTDWLNYRYQNIRLDSSKKFDEYYLDGERLKQREWSSYNDYLLSDKLPKGGDRESILKVNLYTPSQVKANYKEGNTYPAVRKNHYIILEEKKNDKAQPIQQPKQQAQPKPQAAPQQVTKVLSPKEDIERRRQEEFVELANIGAEKGGVTQKQAIDNINGRYDAELAALENKIEDNTPFTLDRVEDYTNSKGLLVNKLVFSDNTFILAKKDSPYYTPSLLEAMQNGEAVSVLEGIKAKPDRLEYIASSPIQEQVQDIKETPVEQLVVIKKYISKQNIISPIENIARLFPNTNANKFDNNLLYWKIKNSKDFNHFVNSINNTESIKFEFVKPKDLNKQIENGKTYRESYDYIKNVNDADLATLETNHTTQNNAPEIVTATQSQPENLSQISPINATDEDKLAKAKEAFKNRKNTTTNVKTRLVTASDFNKKVENIQEVKDWFKNNLPQVDLNIVNELIKLKNGGLAWGTFHGNVVNLYDNAVSGTGYHEAFEMVFTSILNTEEQDGLLKEIRNRKGTFSNFSTNDEQLSYSDATSQQLIEELSNEFGRWKENKEENKDNPIIKFFKKLWEFIKSYFFNQGKINETFSKLDEGFYANKQFLTEQEGTSELSNREKKSLYNGFTYELINEINQKTNSFTYFDELDSVKVKDIFTTLKERGDEFYNLDDETQDTYKAVISAQINDLEARNLPESVFNDQLIKALDKYESKQAWWNNEVKPNWSDFIQGHIKYLKNINVLSSSGEFTLDEEDESKNMVDFLSDAFTRDNKDTAPRSIKLLFNTIAESVFTNQVTFNLDGQGFPEIINKASDITGMSELINNSNQLFNVVLNMSSDINTIEGIKDKLEEILGIPHLKKLDLQEKLKYVKERSNNSIYTSLFKLYKRVFSSDPSKLNEEEVKQTLKFLSVFSKQTPNAEIMYVNADGGLSLLSSSRDKERNNVINNWMKNLTSLSYAKSNPERLLQKGGKRSSIIPFTNLIKQTIESNDLLLKAQRLGLNILTSDVLDELSAPERNLIEQSLNDVLTQLSKLDKVVKLSPLTVKASSSINTIADLIVSKTGDKTDAVRSNLEGKQQQNTVLNNTVSKMIAEFNNYKEKDKFLADNPEYNEFFNDSNNSLLIDMLFKGNTRTNLKLQIGTLEGLRISDKKDTNRKTSKQSTVERLIQEFNSNLEGTFYILVPADSETEWTISVKDNNKKQLYVDYSSNMISEKVVEKFIDYLASEIKTINKFINKEDGRYNDVYLNEERSLFKDSEEKRITGKSLQLFKDILSKELVNKIHSEIDNKTSFEDIINNNYNQIAQGIQSFLESKVNSTFKELINNQIISSSNNSFKSEINSSDNYQFHLINDNFIKSNDFVKDENNKVNVDGKQLKDIIAFREINYMMSNIEATKLFFGNPYFYKDFLKRVKLGLSPKEDSFIQKVDANYRLNDTLSISQNKVKDAVKNKETNEIEQEPVYLPLNHLHHQEYKNHVNTWVFKDHFTFNEFIDNYNKNNTTDAQSFYTLKGMKEFRIKNGFSWSNKQEKLIQVENAYERFLLDKDGKYLYTSKELKKIDNDLFTPYLVNGSLDTSNKKDFEILPILKPSFFGPIANNNYLHPGSLKTSLAGFNYRMVRNTPLESVYLSMLNNKVDILTFESAMKVGAQGNEGKLSSLLDINDFKGNSIDVSNNLTLSLAFKHFGRQVVTDTQKDTNTIGSQATKLLPTDLYDMGIPVDFMKNEKSFENKLFRWINLSEEQKELQSNFYKLEKEHNQRIIDLQDFGYQSFLKRIGITEENGEYKYDSLQKVYDIIKDEMVRRGLPENVYSMLEDTSEKNKNLEALADYKKVSYIILSIIKKSLIKQSLNGGQKVQMASVLFNDLKKEKAELYYKKGDKYIKINSQEEIDNLSPEEKATLIPTSPHLKFYINADGQVTRMQVKLPNIFRKKINDYREKHSELGKISDEDLLKWIKTHQKELLNGIGFRIPTQALSSIDSFEIVGFLPSYFGDSVMVPSELTTKAGSDFDIDKLNTYLANFTINKKGFPEYVKPMNLKDAKEFHSKAWDKLTSEKIQNKSNFIDALAIYSQFQNEDKPLDELTSEKLKKYIENNQDKLNDHLSKFQTDEEGIEFLIEQLDNLENIDLQKEAKDFYVNSMVKKSLENAYFKSIDDILRLPENFNKLTSPNSATELADISNDYLSLIGKGESKNKTYLEHSFILDSNRMRALRHSFVAGKAGVGIAAIAATYNALSQKIGFIIQSNPKNFFASNINFKHSQVEINGKLESIIGASQKENGDNVAQWISKYLDGYVDIAKGAWILDMGATIDVAGIFLLMERLLIPSKEITSFMNQPIIKFYQSIQALKKSPLKKLNEKIKTELDNFKNDESSFDYLKTLLIEPSIDVNGNKLYNEPAQFTFTKESLDKQIIKSKDYSRFSEQLKDMSEEDKKYQFNVFKQFLQFKEYDSYFQSAKYAADHDTANINNTDILDLKEERYQGQLSAFPSVVSLQDFANGKQTLMATSLRDKTFIGNIIKNVTTLDKNLLSEKLLRLDSITARKEVKRISETLNPTLFLSTDKENSRSKLKGILLNNSMYKAFELFTNPKALHDSTLITNLERQLDNFKALIKKNDTIDLANLSENKWANLLDIVPIKPGSAFGFYTIKNGFKKEMNDIFENNTWVSDLNVIKEVSPLFYKSIIYSLLITGGAEFHRENITSLIPWKTYQKYVTEGINNFNKTITDPNIVREIAKSKYYDSDVVPSIDYVAAADYNGVKMNGKRLNATTGKIFDIPFLKSLDNVVDINNNFEIGDMLLVPERSYTNKYNYFTMNQRKSDFTQEQAKAAIKEQDFSYQTKILFEKVYDNDKILTLEQNGIVYSVFRPLQTKGAKYLNEYTNTNQSVLQDVSDQQTIQKSKGLFRDKSGNLIQTFDKKQRPIEFINEYVDTKLEDNNYLLELIQKNIKGNGIFSLSLQEEQSKMPVEERIDTKKEISNTINIYAGTNENAELSNFTIRPFVINGDEFQSVEQYFQYQKWNYLKEDITETQFKEDRKIADVIMNTSNGATLKSLGRKFKNLDNQSWDKNASQEMKKALLFSFEQNSGALQKLLATGNVELTHIQDKGKWGKEFPKLLMEVRNELKSKEDLGLNTNTTQEEFKCKYNEL